MQSNKYFQLPKINLTQNSQISSVRGKQLEEQLKQRSVSQSSLNNHNRSSRSKSISTLLLRQLIPKKIYVPQMQQILNQLRPRLVPKPQKLEPLTNQVSTQQETNQSPSQNINNERSKIQFKTSEDQLINNHQNKTNQTVTSNQLIQQSIEVKKKQNNGQADSPKSKRPSNYRPSGCTTFYFDGKQMLFSKQLNLKEGEYSIGQYSFFTDETNQQNILGQGGFGKVFRGNSVNKEHPQVAIKVMLINSQEILQMCRQETLRQQLVKSNGIVKIYMSKVIAINENQKIFVIASQLMNKGQLTIPQNGYTPVQALEKLKLILRSYQALYRRRMAHRDLKPQNILTNSKGELKISDFGTAKEQTDKKQKINACTLQYASPQQIRAQEHTDKCDVYALGCIFFQMLIGFTPANGNCTKGSNRMDMAKVNKKLKAKQVPEIMMEFLQGCLRQKEFMEIQKDGRIVEDPERSRFSWQNVYLHPLFGGQLISIPKDIAGSDIILTIKTNALSNGVDILSELKIHQKQNSNFLTKNELLILLKNHNIYISSQDMDRLEQMFTKDNHFSISQLLQAFSKLDEEKSNYSIQEVRAFWQMFTCFSQVQKQQKQFNSFLEDIQTEKYQKRQQFWMFDVNFTSFPVLPPLQNLKQLWIAKSVIPVLEIRLNTPILKELRIMSCTVQRVITIRGCPELKILDLYSNKIRQIQGLQLLPKLETLNLQANRIRAIKGIDHLKKLQRLGLGANKISYIEGLSRCPALKELYLQSNDIQQLGDRLLEMARIPLRQLHLYDNKIRATEKNREQLSKFKEQHPDSKVYLSGDINNEKEEFQEELQYGSFEEGHYNIVCFNDPSKVIGIQTDKEGVKIMKLVEKESDSTAQVWYFKLFEKNNYSIFSNNRSEIVWIEDSREDQCTLKPYEEEEEQEADFRSRWEFVKKGKFNQRQVYTIKMGVVNAGIRYSEGGKIGLHLEKDYQKEKDKIIKGSDLWIIESVQKPE